jgi:hypothetical protein
MPITEARTFGHEKVVEYLQQWEANHTNEASEEEELAIRKQVSEQSVPLPQ